MAYDKAILQNPVTGQIRAAPIGFSWTMFFFSWLPPIFRGDWKWFGIILGMSFLCALISFGLLAWLPGIIGSFIWNKSHLNGLLERGYKLKAMESGADPSRVDHFAGFKVPRAADSVA
jgi:hypothetical protein